MEQSEVGRDHDRYAVNSAMGSMFGRHGPDSHRGPLFATINTDSGLSPTSADPLAKTSTPHSSQSPVTPNRFEASFATPESRSTRGSVPSQHVRRRSNDTTGSTAHTTPESSTRPSLTRTASGGRTRGAVVATAGRTRTRPQLGRRKSSSARTVTTNNPRSPRPQPESSERGMAQGVNIAPPDPPRFTRGPPPGLPNPPGMFLMSR
ncbi:hypothetical protein EDD37DRAFT_458478 [Exophiala viscosa]|uniref:uncharacterized protein n=1 Tax=Exophiala viscosa TaxID=2486360 RepID=UPI0021960D60|nr:hypothetical protein EDD37DRAFT_458478 [Exophiala viscosa]